MSQQRITDASSLPEYARMIFIVAACHSERSRGIPLSDQRVASRDLSTTLRSAQDDDNQSPKEMSTSRAVCTNSPLGGTSFKRLTASAIGTWRT